MQSNLEPEKVRSIDEIIWKESFESNSSTANIFLIFRC